MRIGTLVTDPVVPSLVRPRPTSTRELIVFIHGAARELEHLHARGRVHGHGNALDRFCAPEVVRGGLPDAKSDIYSLGAVVRCMADGRHRTTAPLVTLIEQMMSADPARRPTSARVRAATAWLVRRIAGPSDPTLNDDLESTHGDTTIVDVRGLEPPFEACDTVTDGHSLRGESRRSSTLVI